MLSLVLLLAGAGCEQARARQALCSLWDELAKGGLLTLGDAALRTVHDVVFSELRGTSFDGSNPGYLLASGTVELRDGHGGAHAHAKSMGVLGHYALRLAHTVGGRAQLLTAGYASGMPFESRGSRRLLQGQLMH